MLAAARHPVAWYGGLLVVCHVYTLRNPLWRSERVSVSPSAPACANAPFAAIGGGKAAAACPSGVLATCSAASSAVSK
jgi:hypothetical protein